MVKLLAGAFPGRQVHGTGDAAFHGEPLVIEGTTWTTRLPANAVLYGPKPPPHRQARPAAGQRGPAGHLRPDRGSGCGLGRRGHPRLRAGHRGAGRRRRRAVVRQLQDRARPRRAGPRPRLRQGRTTWDCSPSTPRLTRPPSPSGTPGGGPSSRPTRPESRSSASATPATGCRRPSSAPSRSGSSSSPC